MERLARKLKEENLRLLDAANMDARARAIKSSLELTPDSSRSQSSKKTQHKASDEVVAKVIVAAIVIGVLSLPFIVFQIVNSNYQHGIHICIVPICWWIFVVCWSLAFIGLIVGIISGKGKDDATPLIALFAIGYLFGLVQVVDFFVANLSFLGFRHMDATEFFIALGIFGFTVKLVTPAPDETPKQ